MKEFRQYVVQTYQTPPPSPGDGVVGCNGNDTEAQAQAAFDMVVRSATPGFTEYVPTGWKWAPNPPVTLAVAAPAASAAAPTSNPSPAAPHSATPPAPVVSTPAPARAAQATQPANSTPGTPAPAPAAAPAKKTLYIACWAEVKSRKTAYFSAVFDAPAIAAPRETFREMVKTSYGGISRFACAQKESSAEADQQVQQWKGSVPTDEKIVDTGWKP